MPSARLWYVGTDTAKDLIYGRLCVEKRGAGFVHFSKDLPQEFYTQLTSEARVPQRVAGGEAYRWMKSPGARNEALDSTVYAVFCTHMLGLHLYTGKMWERLESIVQPPTADLFRVEQTAEVSPADIPRETQSVEQPSEPASVEPSAMKTPSSPVLTAPLPPVAPTKPALPRRAIQRPFRQSHSARTW
ncbi:terminase gpA endonuclease subunit [Variovorax gossypii]|uniref:terminase gpA endonuclease subunit n=1 Tax=Variovorax gossypii TaxID=1679495 RepID=UPI0030B80E1F